MCTCAGPDNKSTHRTEGAPLHRLAYLATTHSCSTRRETARQLALRGFHVVLGCRDREAAAAAADSIAASLSARSPPTTPLPSTSASAPDSGHPLASSAQDCSQQACSDTEAAALPTVRDRRGGSAGGRARGCRRGGAEVGERLELADQESVRAFAAAFQARHARLDVLVNNAGVNVSTAWLLEDGTTGMVHVRLCLIPWPASQTSRDSSIKTRPQR